MKKWNKLLALLLALVMALGLAACGNGGDDTNSTAPSQDVSNTDSGSDESTEPEGTKTFVFGSDANANTFDPATDLQTNSARALTNSVLETLWKVDNDGNVIDDLAASHEWTGDLELTVVLNEGITFSNGKPLTSDDVLYTL